jgi:hypothetical protein
MPSIKVGLQTNRTSFFDPKTNTYITLNNPVQTITFDDNTDLSGLCHACMASVPALKLYEGQFPAATVDAWKARYELAGLKQAATRADTVQSKSSGVVTASTEKAEEVKISSTSVKEEEIESEEETEEVEEKKSSSRRSSRSASNSKK